MIKFDWQHIALLALALAGAALCAWRPEAARYAGPILAALIPAALAKFPPVSTPVAPAPAVAPGAPVAPPDPPEAT